MRFNRLKLCFACIVTFSVIAGVHLANADEFDELLRYVPGDANALVMINLLSIRNSSESKDADPSQQFAKHFDHLPDNFPTTASKMVLAAEFDLETMEAKWEIAVAKFEHESPFDFFPDAKDSAAGIEIILDRPCCLIDGVQFVQLSNHTVGLIWPAQRQQVSRWIRGSQQRDRPKLSKHLSQFITPTRKRDHDIWMAVDLADVVSLNTIRSAMKSLQVVQRTNSDVDKLTQLFEGLNGIRFEIDISDKTQGKLTLDFEAEAHVLNKRAKEMMLELLGNAGAVLPEFRNWIGDVNGNEAFITGPLSPEGTRQLLSLSTIDTALPQFIQRRNPVILKPSAKLKTEELAEKALRHKSARYLSIITRKIRDLRTGRHSSPTSIDKYSFFVDRYARHIHRMSARGVDHEIANTGIRIADRLNNIVAAIQQAAKRTQAARKYLGPTSITYGAIPYQEITTPYQRYYYYAPFAFWRVNTVKYQELETKYLSELEQKAMEEFEQIEQLIELMNRQLEARFPRLNK